MSQTDNRTLQQAAQAENILFMKPTLGSCYYPEHWPQEGWAEDARRMVDAGLSVVRIGEFAWSRLEPEPESFEWAWMDQAISTLGEAGLEVVLGTPTATPPRWMLDRYPDMLARDANGHLRKFGSRRHYCFSHVGYKAESVRIAELLADRYGDSPHISAWQIDNEYGCHETVVSYSNSAKLAFRVWLREKYGSVDKLNSAWGNVFWSMEYADFGQISLPNLTVTEANPAHVMDFRRFSSDQVVDYNRAQADAIRERSDKPLIHNYMGKITDFDHYRVGEDLEIASWDAYPLGFLEDRNDGDEAHKIKYARQGDPDFQAFHHDLYRAVGKGRWWVMEQQPGPVNWAPYNPAPLPGMVRLWSWEAFAHSAETVCYFRWRQAPFAQEQMHAGLLKPDSSESACFAEVLQVADELKEIGEVNHQAAEVALVFDYESSWAWQTQPQGKNFDYFDLIMDFYRALRQSGLSVDILPPSGVDIDKQKLIVIPGLMHWNQSLAEALQSFSGSLLIGPRTGSKTEHFSIPENLPPGVPGLGCKLSYVESLRPGTARALECGGEIHSWMETLEGKFDVRERLRSGAPVLIKECTINYLAGWPDQTALSRMINNICDEAGIETSKMPEGVRSRRTRTHSFLFNYNAETVEFDGQLLPAAGVIWNKHKT